MVKRFAYIAFLLSVVASTIQAQAQVNVCPYVNHPYSMACLIPDLTQTGQSQNLSRFNTTIAQVLGQLPLAAPVSGFVLGFDKRLGVPIVESQNLGSVLTERGNTVGKHKVFVGFTFQRFVFQTIDGTKLNDLPSVYQYQTIPLGSNSASYGFGSSRNTLSANLNQYTGIIAIGLTDKIDVSLTLPFERVSVAAGYSDLNQTFLTYSSGTLVGGGPGATPTTTQAMVRGSASGVGDLILNVKATVISGEKSKLAGGVETRLPTGDELNLLGTGAYGFKPYVVYSRLGRITPHANFGYQWNSFTALNRNVTGGGNLRLPDSLDYSAGADIGLIPKRLTLVTDFIGEHFFNAPRVVAPKAAGGSVPLVPNCSASGAPAACAIPAVSSLSSAQTVGVSDGSFNLNNAAIGLKLNPVGRLILSANVLIRLDNGGLRPARFVPLVGISYRF